MNISAYIPNSFFDIKITAPPKSIRPYKRTFNPGTKRLNFDDLWLASYMKEW